MTQNLKKYLYKCNILSTAIVDITLKLLAFLMLDMGPRADIAFLWIKRHIIEGFCSSPRIKPL